MRFSSRSPPIVLKKIHPKSLCFYSHNQVLQILQQKGQLPDKKHPSSFFQLPASRLRELGFQDFISFPPDQQAFPGAGVAWGACCEGLIVFSLYWWPGSLCSVMDLGTGMPHTSGGQKGAMPALRFYPFFIGHEGGMVLFCFLASHLLVLPGRTGASWYHFRSWVSEARLTLRDAE